VIGPLGQSCSPVGSFACYALNDTRQMVCNAQGIWASYSACGDGTICDARAGATAGTCVAPDDGCKTYGAGMNFCKNDNVWFCDQFGITSVQKETCGFGCVDAHCVPATGCPPAVPVCENGTECAFRVVAQYFCSEYWWSGTGLVNNDVAALDINMNGTTFDAKLVHIAYSETTSLDSLCPGTSGRHAFNFAIAQIIPSGATIKLKVSAPWRMVTGDAVSPHGLSLICSGTPGDTCITLYDYVTPVYAWIYTDDPSAGSTNLLVEKDPSNSASCP
jgi:hypothetical protein